jgi:hypothetical protein
MFRIYISSYSFRELYTKLKKKLLSIFRDIGQKPEKYPNFMIL